MARRFGAWLALAWLALLLASAEPPSRYGGEAESMFIYEVWRERENTTHTGEMARYHEESLSVALWKNKRPPGRLEQFEFHIDPNSGLISEYAQHLVP